MRNSSNSRHQQAPAPKSPSNVSVKADEGEEPLSVEILQKHIVAISDGTAKLLKSGLKEETIVLLIHDACKVGKPDIRKVLKTLPNLKRLYTI